MVTLASASPVSVSLKLKSPALNGYAVSSFVVTVLSVAVGTLFLEGSVIVNATSTPTLQRTLAPVHCAVRLPACNTAFEKGKGDRDAVDNER